MTDGRESRFEAHLGRAVSSWVGWAAAHAAPVALACLLVSFAASLYAVRYLGIHSDIHSMVSDDVPFMALRRDFERSFPLVDDMLLLVVDGDTPEAAIRAAGSLAERLAAEEDVFRSAFVPGGGPFFEKHGLLYLPVEELEDLADVLAQAQPFLAEVQRDPSLRAVFGLMTRFFEAVRDGSADGLDPVPLFDRVSLALESLNRDERPADAWRELLVGEFGREEQTRQVVLLSPILDLDSFQPAARAVERVRRIVDQEDLAGRGVRARLTGDFVLTYEENEVLVGQAAAVAAASFVLVSILLGMAMRSAWLIGAAVVTLLVGMACSLAFAAALIGELNPITVAFPILFIGLSADYGIHLLLRYRELRGEDSGHLAALAETGRGVGSSVVLCAVTTAIGFFAFVPTEFIGLADLGWMAGTAMFISLFFSLTLLPALLTLAPRKVQVRWSQPQGASRVAALRVDHPWKVRFAALALGLGALALLPQAHFDPNQLHVRDPNTESVKAFEDLLASAETSPWTVSLLAADRAQAREVARRVEALDVVEVAVTPDDLVPGDQEEKLDVIDGIASFLAPTARAGRESPPSLQEQLRSLRDLESEAAAFAEWTDDAELERRGRRMAEAVAALGDRIEAAEDPARELERIQEVLLGPMRWRLERLRRAVTAESVALEDLPHEFRELMIGRDQRIRVEVFPSGDVGDPAELARFVDGVREVWPEVTGHAVYLLEFGRSMVRSFQQALLIASVAIAILLWVLWRRIDDTLVALGTIGLALLLTTAAALLLGIPFNFADVIALPLLVGLGVDSSIHLVHRYRAETGQAGRLLRTSTARAVTYSALTTLASFGTLSFAPHRGMATIGQLLTIGVVLTLLCTLVVLPALLSSRNGNGGA